MYAHEASYSAKFPLGAGRFGASPRRAWGAGRLHALVHRALGRLLTRAPRHMGTHARRPPRADDTGESEAVGNTEKALPARLSVTPPPLLQRLGFSHSMMWNQGTRR